MKKYIVITAFLSVLFVAATPYLGISMDSTDLLHPFNPLNPNLFDPRNTNPIAPMLNPAHPLAPLYHDDKDTRKHNDEDARNIRKMEDTAGRETTNFKVYIGNREVTNLLSVGALIGGAFLVVILASRLKNQTNRRKWQGQTDLAWISPTKPRAKNSKRRSYHEKNKE